MPNARAPDLKQRFEEEESERQRLVQESTEHRRAKDLIATELRRRLQAELSMPWWFKDDDASDYPLEGNLLTIPRPTGPADLQGHRSHMTMARVLLSHANALVGYKYSNGIDNNDPEDNVWIHRHWVKEQGLHTTHRVLPKRLAEPVNRLMQVVGDLQQLRHTETARPGPVA